MLSFGGFLLRSDPVALFRDGHPVRLQAQPLRLLELLASRPGELVTHKEIRQHLWRGHVVDFSAGIQVCITQIRKALDDDAASPRFIETVARHGYRFIARIETDFPADAPTIRVAAARIEPAPSAQPLQRASSVGFRRPLVLATTVLAGVACVALLLALPDWQEDVATTAADEPASRLFERAQHLSSYEQRDRAQLAHQLLQRAISLNSRHGPSRNARAAACTARSMSSGPPSGARDTSAPEEGSITAKVLPDAAGTRRPSISMPGGLRRKALTAGSSRERSLAFTRNPTGD